MYSVLFIMYLTLAAITFAGFLYNKPAMLREEYL
jgi:hypothetical protein